LSGKDPTEFNPSDPIRLWIVQVGEWRVRIPRCWQQAKARSAPIKLEKLEKNPIPLGASKFGRSHGNRVRPYKLDCSVFLACKSVVWTPA